MNEQRTGGEGYVTVRVSTARGAIPISGAEVTIRKSAQEESDVLYSLISGNDGMTRKVTLPAPPRTLSESPGGERPYETYTIEVRAEGYTMQYFAEVPVFDGITSYQTADLIPLSDNRYTDNFTYDGTEGFESTGPDL